MARFEDFNRHEKRVLREAMAWSQSEFYDPGHTEEDRATLQALITEAKAAEIAAQAAQQPAQDAPEPEDDPEPTEAPEPAEEHQDGPVGGFDRGGHPVIRHQDGTVERIEQQAARPFYLQPDHDGAREYKGFLYIKCAHCGDIHAFCAKTPTTTYRCAKCGGKTPLTDMHHLRVICECGARHSYQTNLDVKQMDVECFECGSPVAVEWNDRFQKYATIGAQTGRHGRKGGGRR